MGKDIQVQPQGGVSYETQKQPGVKILSREEQLAKLEAQLKAVESKQAANESQQ